ncbi:MAG: acetyltransferase [Deltaproteobacteria bacterium]|nr:acetyltransferase [Deltaproteobacteria bacterium]
MNRAAAVGCVLVLLAACEAGDVVRAGGGDDLGGMEVAFPDRSGEEQGLEQGQEDSTAETAETAEKDEAQGPDQASDEGQGEVEEAEGADVASEEVAGDEGLVADVAGEEAGPEVIEPVAVTESEYWDRVERYRVDAPGLVPDPFTDQTRHKDTEIFNAFGTAEPPAGDFLLHHAAGWDSGKGRAVLLVHGAGTDANGAFARPEALSDDSHSKTLAAAGFRVFAITFPHPFGDNRNQAILIARALEVVRAKTGETRAAVVAHSKGGLAASAYVRGAAAKAGVSYADDVDVLVLLGAPLGGMDWSFRHPAFNWPAAAYDLPMPTSWDKVLEWGQWKDITERSIYGGAYAGLLQSLVAWDKEYTLSVVEQDWYTTYYGGQGFVSHSRGIYEAIELGGSFMAELAALPAPPGLAVAAGAGANPMVGTVLCENTGPSDGLVFVKSALDLSAFEAAGCEVRSKETFALANHWDLLSADAVRAFVAAALGEP